MPALHVTGQPIRTQDDNIKIALTATLDPYGIVYAGLLTDIFSEYGSDISGSKNGRGFLRWAF